MVPPATPASETGRTLPVVPATRNTGCWLTLLGEVYPTATMVPADATVAPTTDSVSALPSDPVCCQAPPVPVLVNATSWPAALAPATTKPKLLPLTSPGFHPEFAPLVPADCHRVPCGEKYAPPSGVPLAHRPGRPASRPDASEPSPVIAVPPPWSAGTVTRVQVEPPLVLSQTPA